VSGFIAPARVESFFVVSLAVVAADPPDPGITCPAAALLVIPAVVSRRLLFPL
jgi:hypothetical protein